MIDFVCSNKDQISSTVLILILLLEYWLGKTDKTKAGSSLELLINGLEAILSKEKK